MLGPHENLEHWILSVTGCATFDKYPPLSGPLSLHLQDERVRHGHLGDLRALEL